MKKILCLILCAVLIFSFAACGKKVDESSVNAETSALEGKWVIEKADYIENTDPMASAMISILKSRFAKDMEIEFKEDGKATVGEAEVEYSMEGDLLTITWENNKNFMFKTTKNGDKLDLTVENVLDATIANK